MAAKLNVSKLFIAITRKRAARLRRSTVRPFAIDEFELGEAQKEADMIEPLARGLCGDLFIFAHEGRQFELPRLPMRASKSRRRCWSGSGNAQFCKGAA